jgi:DNA-binding transcriptional regulator GbsR (MarR family)
LKTENSVNKIFESKLSNEINQNIEKVNKINQLKNQQQQLNQDIQSKQNLLKIADPNSPAQEKLQSELDKLNSDLDINLQELDMLVNQ